MNSNTGIPDAWDDDWTNVADTKSITATATLPSTKLSKAEKRAQHQQLQKEIWASAESPSRNLWLEAQGAVPLKQEFVPAMTVLSRKPQIAKKASGIAGLSLDDEDSEEESRKKRESELAERQQKAKLEREEKVRKYAEARERIMGSSTSKTKSDSRESSQGRSDSRRQRNAVNSQPPSSRASPARAANGLYDPEDMARRIQKKDDSGATTPKEGEPIRQPRGPDSTGRAGFGGNARGGRVSN